MLEIILLLKRYFTENKLFTLLKAKRLLTTILFFSILTLSFAQNATIKGVILDENNKPIEKVSIKSENTGTTTNANGFYSISIPSNKDVIIEFTHLSYKKIVSTFSLKNGEELEFNPVMSTSIEQIAAVVVNSRRKKDLCRNNKSRNILQNKSKAG